MPTKTHSSYKTMKWTGKRNDFFHEYVKNGGNGTEAYKVSHKPQNMKENSISSEAAKITSSPVFQRRLATYRSKIREGTNIDAQDLVKDLLVIKKKCMEKGKWHPAIKALEQISKLIGGREKMAFNFEDLKTEEEKISAIQTEVADGTLSPEQAEILIRNLGAAQEIRNKERIEEFGLQELKEVAENAAKHS